MFVVFCRGFSGKGMEAETMVLETRERPGKDIERGEEAVERGKDLISPTFKRKSSACYFKSGRKI